MHGGSPRVRKKYQTGAESDSETSIEVNTNEILNIVATAALTTAATVAVNKVLKEN